jgi:hypothetical protein
MELNTSPDAEYLYQTNQTIFNCEEAKMLATDVSTHTPKYGDRIRICDLRLGDVIQVLDGPWGTATVRQIKNGIVYMDRPYGTSADFSCTSGVICYIGCEHIEYPASSANLVTFWSRKDLK